MTTDIEASLAVSLDLSSVVEEAVRSAVCSVLTEIQRLVGKNVAELRAAVVRKDCENEKLRAQLESARRQLQEQAGLKNKQQTCGEVGSCHQDDRYNTRSNYENTLCHSDEITNCLGLPHDSSTYALEWDKLAGKTFTDSSSRLKPEPVPDDAEYNVEKTEPDTDAELLLGSEPVMSDPTVYCRQNGNYGQNSADSTKDLRVVQVKEEVPGGQQQSYAPGPADLTKPKPYICGECGKSYLWLKNLKKHQKIHTGEAPFSCNICCKHFSSQQVFEEHQRVHTGERPHQCAYCPKTFNHLSSLKKHQLIHTGEKPHHCNLCGKRFRQIQHLKEHRKTHEDSKPFRCWECGWGFNRGSNFKRHLLVHTRQKMRHGTDSSV